MKKAEDMHIFAALLALAMVGAGPESAFDAQAGSWAIEWPGRVSRHDLVYLSPPTDPMEGIALGNGDTGALIWCDGSRIICAINKCDLWDFAPPGRFHNWKSEEEDKSTTLRHACRLIIDFQLPVFDEMYLTDFQGRLSLADATISIKAVSAFGTVSLRAFIDANTGVLHWRIEQDLRKTGVDVKVERFGSRTFSHWYAQVNRDASIGVAGTQSFAEKGFIGITQALTNGCFAAGCRISGIDAAADAPHDNAGRFSFEAGKAAFELTAGVTDPGNGERISALREKLSAANFENGLNEHSRAWREFWQRSLMESGDKYLDGLWHVTMYYARASQGGRYPGRFINGLWNWNRDFDAWNFYFHWNQQQVYWPLNAAGHPELIESYLRYRFDSLPLARDDAREVFKSTGAVVSDVTDGAGYNSAGEFNNHTPVAQIALDFWRQYQYTRDRRFLKERALPYMLDAARFFETLFEKDSNGRYHAKRGTGYEGWIQLHDAVSELACGKALFAAVLAALDEAGESDPSAPNWKMILENLAPLPLVELDAAFLSDDGKLKRGLFKDSGVPGRSAYAAGFGIKENRLINSIIPAEVPDKPYPDPFESLLRLERNDTPYTYIREDLKCNDGIFPWIEFAPVYPSGVVGLKDRATSEFAAAVTTAKAFACAGMGWDPLPIVLARLGMNDELERVLNLWPERWQWFSNGWGHYGPRDFMKADASLRFRTNSVRDTATKEQRFPFSAWPYRHMGMESMSVLATAMNESLLQSDDGVIRVAPAVSQSRRARFTLHATGGFIVSAEIVRGAPLWVCIRSTLGGPCAVAKPWATVYVHDGKKALPLDGEVVKFDTEPGGLYLLAPAEMDLAEWNVKMERPETNQAPLTHGRAQLGLPRRF
jgi:hypothetical protein